MKKFVKFNTFVMFALMSLLLFGCDDMTSDLVNFYFGSALDNENNSVTDYAISYKAGERINRPEDVYKPGYVFGGWLQDDLTPWIFNVNSPVKPLNLTINWLSDDDKYLSYVVDSEIIFRTKHEDSHGIIIDEEGYLFYGWYLDPICTTEATFPLSQDTNAVYGKVEQTNKVTDGLVYRLNEEKNGYIIDKYLGNEVRVYVPDAYLGLPIVEIGDYAFYNKVLLSRVHLPKTITRIGSFAFADCFKLSYIIMPEELIEINEGAFSSNFNLAHIDFNDKLVRIDKEAFYYCIALQDINLGANVSNIGEWAFYSCNDLATITVNQSNNFYSSLDGVLYNETQTTILLYPSAKQDTDFEVPSTVTKLYSWCFANALYLESIVLPMNLEEINTYSFSYCVKLTTITIPKNVVKVGKHAFYNFTNLTIRLSSETSTELFEQEWNNSGLSDYYYSVVTY